MFLLMDPNVSAASSAERGLGNSIFCLNPAAATSRLAYDVKNAGPFTMDLLGKDGKSCAC